MTKDEASEIMYNALGAEFGVLLFADDPKRTVQELQQLRRVIGDPELNCLVFREVTVLEDGNVIASKKGPAR